MSEPMKPMEIEQRSFEIITELLGNRVLDPENELVIKRVIHTTADFDYADNLTFSDHAVQKGIAALKGGCDIVTDTQMAKAGINKTILASLGGEVHCFMSDPDVAQEARSRGVTRAFVSMEKAAALDIRKVPLIAHDDPRRVNIQHFAARGCVTHAENALAFNITFHIAAGIRGHAGSIERWRIAVKIRQHFIRIHSSYYRNNCILVKLRVVHFLIQLIFRQRHPGQRNAQHQQKGHQTFHLLSSPVETVSVSHYTIPLADRQGGGCRIYKFGVHSDAFIRFSDIFPFSRPYSPRS